MNTPGYWMAETSGELAGAVRRYVSGATLAERELELMKAYLRQWTDAPMWGPSEDLDELRIRVQLIETEADIHYCVAELVGLGMDPL